MTHNTSHTFSQQVILLQKTSVYTEVQEFGNLTKATAESITTKALRSQGHTSSPKTRPESSRRRVPGDVPLLGFTVGPHELATAPAVLGRINCTQLIHKQSLSN